MHVLILGAAGMIGRKLTTAIVKNGGLNGKEVDTLTLVDVIAPPAPEGFSGQVNAYAANIAEPATAQRAVTARPDVIFHLAAIVSGDAEANLEKGYTINLDGTRLLFDAVRLEHERSFYCPRVVFTSSIAVYGTPFPDVIDDDFALTPLTSYGAQKAMSELMLADYSRRGIMDGIGLRLPTICVRPGKPNLAASGFFSGIIREPLSGLEAILPVADTVRHWFASPRAAVGFLIHAAGIDLAPLSARRSLILPGQSVTVAEQIEALRRIAGDKAVSLIRRQPDEKIATIVNGWAKAFAPRRAEALGFVADKSFDEIIQVYIEDDMPKG
ncbi:D-erythronate dehydrogenase [Acidocella sp.]|jgi:nucleoside-diphosphate-sugar epimerase|uniref:D-erythronate dehydrogenase n=1 Tax=Acidocella sp. TaxID=50710 RepID=UPI002F4300AA